MNKIASDIDGLATRLETLGLRKLAALLDAVANTVAKSAAKEVEVRMTLAEVPAEFVGETAPEQIKQGFIVEVPGLADVRIRQTVSPEGEASWTMTAKYRPEHEEAEQQISQKLFEALWPTVTKPQLKKRYKVEGWDIDAVEGGEVFAEYELKPEEIGGQLQVPPSFKVVGEPRIPVVAPQEPVGAEAEQPEEA
jgi:hypothetical protein